MTLLSKADLFGKSDRRYRVESLPVGGEVRIQSLTAGEMRAFRLSLMTADGKLIKRRGDRVQMLLVAQCLVDESGNRLLSDDEAMSADADKMDGAVIGFLFARCREWTGFQNDDDWSAIEAAIKNSNGTDTN